MSYFVLQIDGHAKSGYRRFTDALKAALRLKDQIPDHNGKVRAIRASNSSHKSIYSLHYLTYFEFSPRADE
jgi:hypothetical protein